MNGCDNIRMKLYLQNQEVGGGVWSPGHCCQSCPRTLEYQPCHFWPRHPSGKLEEGQVRRGHSSEGDQESRGVPGRKACTLHPEVRKSTAPNHKLLWRAWVSRILQMNEASSASMKGDSLRVCQVLGRLWAGSSPIPPRLPTMLPLSGVPPEPELRGPPAGPSSEALSVGTSSCLNPMTLL